MGAIKGPGLGLTARDFYEARVSEVTGDRSIRHRKERINNYLTGQLEQIRDGRIITVLQDGAFALITPRLFLPAINELHEDLGQTPPVEFILSDLHLYGDDRIKPMPIWLRKDPSDETKYSGADIIDRAVSVLSEGNEEFKHGLKINWLNYLPKGRWTEAFIGDGIVNFGGNQAKVDIGLVTTPPMFHLDGADALKNAGVNHVYVEKPWGPALDSELPNKIRRQVQNGILGTDFFVYGDAISFLKRRPELLENLGTLKEVHAVCSEPWPPELGRGLTKESVMGSGVFSDTASHCAAIVDDFLRWRYENKHSLTDTSLNLFERGRLFGFEGDAHLETFGTTYGTLNTKKDGQVKILLAGGKGTGGRLGGTDGGEYPFLGMTLLFEKGRVEVSLGFPNRYNPYVAVIPDDTKADVQFFEIEGGKLGYNAMFADWISRAQGSLIAKERIQNVSLAAENAMGYLTRAYNAARADNFRLSFYPQGEIPGNLYAFGSASPLIKVSQDMSMFEQLGNSRESTSLESPFTGRNN